MTIKILCDCGTKFAFEIEPIDGKMPAAVSCPSCSRDAMDAANEVIAQQLGPQAPATVASAPVAAVSGGPMKVAPPAGGTTAMRVAAPAAITAVAEPPSASETASAPLQNCGKHPNAPGAANCVVCQKSICLDCMALFGYLCSAYCRGLAARKNIYVPPYAGMNTELMHAEAKQGNKLLMAVGSAFVVFFALFVWYSFFGSKPRLAWKLESSPSARFIHSQWIGKDKILAVASDKAGLYQASSGKQIWESSFKSDEKVEQKSTTVLDDEDADFTFFSALRIRTHVAGKDLWVIFPRKAVRFDVNSGNRKQEIPLPQAIEDGSFSDAAFLGIAKPAEGKHVLARIDFNSGKLQSIALTQAVTRVNNPNLNNRIPTAGSGYVNAERASDSFGAARLAEDRREYFLSGSSVVHVNIRLLEQRFTQVQAMREQKGPSIIDSGNARASQGFAAAEEFLNESRRAETGGVRLEDESRYMVNLRRPFGGGSAWSGEVVGPPAFFPLNNLDLLVAGKSIYAFNKSGQKMWESKISYPLAPRFIEGLTDERPALEYGSKLYFFDQGNLIGFEAKNGQVAWRLQSVGISSIARDQSGKLYVSTTTAGPEQIKYSEEVSLTDKIHPAILKVDPATGAILWQKDRLGKDASISGKYLYATQSRVSGIDRFSALTSGRDSDVPVHSRVYRLDPSTGKELWEYYRSKPPQKIEPLQNRVLLQYGNEVGMLKFFSL
jgi:outer membrane protein assembly factor BamB